MTNRRSTISNPDFDKTFATPIDMEQKEIKNSVVHKVKTDPDIPVEGQIWYKSPLKTIQFFDGNVVQDLVTQSCISGKKPYHGVVARPVGVSNPLPTNLTTTTFTLGATANPISYYYLGSLVNVTSNKTATLDDGAGGSTAGIYYVYFNAATGNILATKIFPGITCTSNVIIATVNWNGSNYGLVNDERHGYCRDHDWHAWAHNTVGCRYKSGITLTHNSGTGNAATFATTSGEIWDEDIQFTVNASSAFPTPNTCRLFYQTGASAYTFITTPSTVPGYLGANQRPYYVNSTGYALTEMSSAPNRYINVFVYATTSLHTPIQMFTETVSPTIAADNGYTSLANARAVPFPNLSGYDLSPELKPIYRLIWRADGVLQTIDTTQDDYRTVGSLPMSAGTVSTTASAVTFSPSGNISATTVQTAIEELDLEKLPIAGGTLTGNLLFTDNTLDIGANGATRPRTGYFGTSLISPLFNGLTITNNGTNTLTIAAGKTLTANNTLTFSGTDSSTLNIGTGGTLGTGAYATIANYAPLSGPTFTGTVTLPKTLEIQDTSADHQYVLAVSELTADRTVTLPLLTGNDEFVFKDHPQIINKKVFNFSTAMASDHSWEGDSMTGTAGENLVLGDFVYYKSDGKWWKAKADAYATARCKGIATTTINANATGTIFLKGTFRDDSWAWTTGDILWLSAGTAGTATATQPSTTGNQIVYIGFALDADNIYFNPSNDIGEK